MHVVEKCAPGLDAACVECACRRAVAERRCETLLYALFGSFVHSMLRLFAKRRDGREIDFDTLYAFNECTARSITALQPVDQTSQDLPPKIPVLTVSQYEIFSPCPSGQSIPSIHNKMSQNRITGLASAFEAPQTASKPNAPSAVSTLASRFDAPAPAKPEQPKVSTKLSGIASRFGSTIADEPIGKKRGAASKPGTGPKMIPTRPPVIAEQPDFSAISRRFASGRMDLEDGTGGKDSEEGGMFSKAKDAFKKREEEARTPVEGVVSQFRRNIERGGTRGGQEETGGRVVEKGEVVEEEKKGDVGEEEKEESLASRFQKAAKVFGGEE